MDATTLMPHTPTPETSAQSIIQETLSHGNETSPQAKAAQAESKAEAQPPEPKPDKWAPKFAALTRKEKQVREMERAIKERESKLQEQLSELEKFQKDQFAYLEEKDPDAYKKWTQRKIAGVQGPTVDEKLAALEKKLTEKEEAERQSQLDAVKREQEQFYANTAKDIKEFIGSNQELYENLAFEDEQSPGFGPALVYQVMHQFWEKTKKETGSGKTLSYAEACEMAEKYLTDRDLQRLNKVKKLKPATTPTNEESSKDSFQQSLAQKSPTAKTGTPKTLTNQMTAEIPNRGERKLSIEESKERLAREFIKFVD